MKNRQERKVEIQLKNAGIQIIWVLNERTQKITGKKLSKKPKNMSPD
jgi:hypothetical protein